MHFVDDAPTMLLSGYNQNAVSDLISGLPKEYIKVGNQKTAINTPTYPCISFLRSRSSLHFRQFTAKLLGEPKQPDENPWCISICFACIGISG